MHAVSQPDLSPFEPRWADADLSPSEPGAGPLAVRTALARRDLSSSGPRCAAADTGEVDEKTGVDRLVDAHGAQFALCLVHIADLAVGDED
jgi:hypothetical protein